MLTLCTIEQAYKQGKTIVVFNKQGVNTTTMLYKLNITCCKLFKGMLDSIENTNSIVRIV
jgi:hypothetical protein